MSRAIHDLSDILINFTGDNRLLLSHCSIGDLILTCNSSNSRNYTYGMLLAKDKNDAESFLSSHTVEGYNTLKILIKMLDEKNFDIKVVSILNRIIFNNEDIRIIEDYILNK
jgi:glycerol-3-phosphate dehydrogenase (NAD(P)+)